MPKELAAPRVRERKKRDEIEDVLEIAWVGTGTQIFHAGSL
jgi:hypothetical protein